MLRIISTLCAVLAMTACDNGAEQSAGSSVPAAEPAAAPSLIGTRWEWVSTITPVERTEARDPTRYTLLLQADGKAQVQLDCNRGAGNYELADNKLTFGPLLSTRMACPEDTQDHIYMEQLGKIGSYFVRDGELYLEMPYDSGTMRFRAASSQN